jgi:tRNA pseudouridine55 synthase
VTGRTTAAGHSGRARWRDVDGIVLLDKPAGLGSTRALQHVRRLLRAAKAGHAGTLDPMASGMLPLCFGQATKACSTLLGSRKSYRARLDLGAATDSGDADGRVIRHADVPVLNRDRVLDTLGALQGVLEQRPPMYSAVKHRGQPLYELARRGEEVARAPRQVTIHRLELCELQAASLEFEVVCSKGTYVRVLGEQIAAALGTEGHLGALRRLWVEPFECVPMVELEAVEGWARQSHPDDAQPAWLRPVDSAFIGLPRLELDAGRSLHLCQGRTIAAADAPAAVRARAYDPTGRFLGLVEPAPDGTWRVVRLFVPGSPGVMQQSA